jgi:hypothetical protein
MNIKPRYLMKEMDAFHDTKVKCINSRDYLQ